ncbi:DMT family transporter [Notoacmeibacter sp. MSK16QG-6]|uniref:DMT family transporter n=1 Tax=Notoacmeibacter sp. MSK16QG-6 TaxID=2957982 RepID=UPI0020A15F3F|nr:DMT family transporter [Notoacmeibacter sp. MSK16QG-6]MCP1199536.1 DMT family transporter [Notoacmeibacter sp. MSK16QG-6]
MPSERDQTGSFDRSALIGAILMMLVSALMAVDSVLVRLVSDTVHPFMIGFTRALFGLIAVAPWLLGRPGILRSHYRFRHFFRAALKLASLVAFFYGFALATLADVTAIAFTSPFFVTLGAWMFLGETLRPARLLAIFFGFAGVLVILMPGHEQELSEGLLFALLGAVLTAAIQLILKPMTARDSSETLVAWNLILMVPIAAVPALFVWTTPSPTEWIILAIQGVIGAASMTLATKAFSLAEASLITPFDFLRLPFVAVLGYLLLAETVPQTTWIGGIVIFVSTFLMARTTRRREHNLT